MTISVKDWIHHIRRQGSSGLFLQLGIGVILLSLACLPIKAKVVNGVDLDIVYMGPIFALLIGAWSLPSLLFATIESSTSLKLGLGFTLVLSISNIFLVFMAWQYVRFPYTNITPFVTPCVIADIAALGYFLAGRKVTDALRNPKVRVLLVITLAAFPVLTLVGNLVQGTIFY